MECTPSFPFISDREFQGGNIGNTGKGILKGVRGGMGVDKIESTKSTKKQRTGRPKEKRRRAGHWDKLPFMQRRKMAFSASTRKKRGGTSHSNKRTRSKGNSFQTDSISCGNVEWRNCLVDKRNSSQIAKGVWEFGKQIGLNYKGPEEEIIKKLEGLEDRDRRAAGKEVGGYRGG